MADRDVRFMHPTDGRMLNVELDDTMTAREMIAELISNNFIASDPQGYKLAIKGGSEINENQSLRDLNVQNGVVIRVIPQTDAGKN